MSKKNKISSNFKYELTTVVPKIPKIKTEWDLKKHYYKSETDPKIEADVKKTEVAYSKFTTYWKKRNFVSSPKVLNEALVQLEKLSEMPEGGRPGRYFSLRLALNANDKVAEKHLSLLSRRFRKLSDSILFFSLTLGKLPKTKQRELLRSSELAHYHYYLEQLFLGARYHLSEEQEKIISLKSSQSYGRWVNMTEQLLSNRSISWRGAVLPIPEALETLDTLKSKDKPKFWKLLMESMEDLADVAEHEFNAIITDVRTEEELRGYQKPYSSTALSYEDTEKSIENLVEAVSDKGFKLSQKFYKLKAQHQGVKQIAYPNKYDDIGTEPVIPFAQAVNICRDVFYSIKDEYGKVFDTMLTNGQIDVYPKKGKRGGAFMSSAISQPTHVFLNHLHNFKSLETLAHEMGHAIHSERSKVQSAFYEGHSITTAETASTLFENFVFDAVYSQLPDAHKMSLLHSRITRDIATIQRQIACFNTELEIHTTIDKTGAMSKEELRACLERHLKSYLGPAVAIEPSDGYSFVYWPHLRFGFYTYTYSFGLLMSTIMANRYQADNSYIEQIDHFLSAGQSDTVANIFKSIGIDTAKRDTFSKALDNHAEDIAQFELFVKQNGA